MSKRRVIKKRPGFRISDKDASVIGVELEAIKQRLGRWPTSREVLDHARPQRSKLHRFFDWDDSAAAEKWRLSQASYIVRAVEVVYVKDEREYRCGRGVYNVNVEYDQEVRREHRPVEVIVSVKEHHEQVIDYALQQLEGWEARYKDLLKVKEFKTLFAGVFREIATAKAKRRTKKSA